MARLEWFSKYGVEPGRFDPINSRKMTAPIIAEMLLDMYGRQEIERLAYKTERWPGTPQQCRHEAKWQWENYCLWVRACYLLDMEPGEFVLKGHVCDPFADK